MTQSLPHHVDTVSASPCDRGTKNIKPKISEPMINYSKEKVQNYSGIQSLAEFGWFPKN